MASDETKRYNAFLIERGWIVEDIRGFLTMVLTYFLEMEEMVGRDCVVKANKKSAKSLIKSLCQIHAFYGHPAEIGK